MKASKKTVILFRLLYLSVLLTLTIALFFNFSDSIIEEEIPVETNLSESVSNVFGFHSASLEQKVDRVKKNQTLSEILYTYGLSSSTVHQIAQNSKDIFDVRQIKAGKTYHAFTENDTSNFLKYFVYEKDHINYVVYDLSDSISIYEGRKHVTVKLKTKTAVIDHSLYSALSNSDAPAELAVKLSQIFAWQIDFYQLQKGDNFKVIYEEEYTQLPLIEKAENQNMPNREEGFQLVGIGKILGAHFQHIGKDFYAIPYTQQNTSQYFDERGNSLRKAFLKAPIEFSRISSRYSKNRLHPVLRTNRPHYGTDYAAPTGTPIRTTGDGIITEIGYNKGSGNFIKVRHNSVYTTMYLHMSRFVNGIKKGSAVKQGQVIGFVGSTGLATGPHLCYRFYVNGKPVDALKVEVPPSHPVEDEFKADFEIKKNKIISLLNASDSILVFEHEPYVLSKLTSK